MRSNVGNWLISAEGVVKNVALGTKDSIIRCIPSDKQTQYFCLVVLEFLGHWLFKIKIMSILSNYNYCKHLCISNNTKTNPHNPVQAFRHK